MDTLIIIGIVAIVVAALGYSFYSNKKRKDASWEGVVIDKSISEHTETGDRTDNGSGVSVNGIRRGSAQQSAVTHSYSLSVKLASDKVIDWSISSGMYDTVSIGDKLIKRPGTTIPEIVK